MVAPLRPGLVGTAVRQAGGLLVGREREISLLTDALSGGARSCVVHGATGMGKSALLSVASSIALRSGLRPVRGLRALSGVDSHTVLVVDDVERLSEEEADRLARFRGAVLLAGDCDPDDLSVFDAVRVPLRPIGAEAVAEMIRRRFDVEVSPELAALCLEYSGGAPGVLSDVLEVVTDVSVSALRVMFPVLRVPRLLRAVRRSRQALDADAVAVARALAVLGSTSLDVLCEVAGMGSFRTLAAFERLVDARMAVDEPMRVQTPALSHAIRHEMVPEERERLHLAAAQVLQRRCDSPVVIAEHVVACAEPVGAGWTAPVLHGAARLHRAAGRPEQAARCLRAALREPLTGEVAAEVAVAMADLHLRCGIAPRAGELARQRVAAGDWFDAVVLDWQCDEDLLGGDPVVPEDPEQALRDLPESGPLVVPSLALAGLGLLRQGSEQVVLELAPQLRVRLVGAERDWLAALEMWAHRANGDHAEVSRLMRELAQASPLRGCVALGATAFVASCVDAGRPSEAREMLVRLGYTGALPPAWACVLLLRERARMHLALGAARAALADAERAGAAELADQARAALAEPRHRPARGAAWDKLTPHESRIVLLALEGETNRAIAARFGVTQRAVELHLTRVYRKVGISRRVQLSAVFPA